MKRIILLVGIIGILIVGNFVMAKDKPEGGPFQAIWDAINHLVGRMTTLENNVSDLNSQVNQLEERIDQLENRECTPGNTETCDTGLPGICSIGTKTCSQQGAWGECIQNNQPTLEVYDGLDNDCDGEIDENLGIVQDNFNAYTNGSIVGQGNWNSYINGNNFIVQGTTIFEGARALYNNSVADSVIYKTGTSLSDGRQAVYVRTENRANWGEYLPGNAQVRVSKGPWQQSELRNYFLVTFKRDGNVAFYNEGGNVYTNFATYNDNEWTLVEIEWCSSDKTARCRVNNGIWTDWHPFAGSGTFTDFDTVGFDFDLPTGSGGVYIDSLY